MPAGAEWIYIILIVVILFGAKKLPELARGLGRSVGEFKKAKEEFDREMNSVKDEVTDERTASARKIDQNAQDAEFKKVDAKDEKVSSKS